MMRFAYKYLFKGFGWVFLFTFATALVLFLHGCSPTKAQPELRAVENETLKAVIGNPSTAMREFSLETRKAPVKPKYQ